MCDFDYERFFCLKHDDDAELLRINEDLQRQVMDVDDDDDDDVPRVTSAPSLQNSSAVGNMSSIPSGNVSRTASVDAQLRSVDVKDVKPLFVSPQNAYVSTRANEVVESRSISSSLHSRGHVQLSSSGTQTPTHASNDDSLRVPAPLASQMFHNEVNKIKASLLFPQDVATKPAPPYSHQDECPPPYESFNNTQPKHVHGVTPVVQSVSPSSNRVSSNLSPTSTTQQSFFPCAVVAPSPQLVAANALPSGGLQARQVMMPQQGVNGVIAQPVNITSIQPTLQHALQAAPLPPPLAQTSPALQQQQQQPQPHNAQPLQAHPVQQQSQAQYMTGAVPSGYTQVLVPTRSADGSAGYQLMMMPAHQMVAQGTNGVAAHLFQVQHDRVQLQPHNYHSHNQQQNQHLHQQQLQSQQQAMVQQVWQLPQQAHGQHQPPQNLQPQQLLTPQYGSVPQTPQRYAVVSANGQQQYVMALTMGQVQQLQQAQVHQQQNQRHFSFPAQQQQNMTQSVYFASQPPQSMFTNSFSHSGGPLAYGFN